MLNRLQKFATLSWGLTRVFFQLIYGVWRISKLSKPIVSIFGSARFKGNDIYFLRAWELSQKLVSMNISVLTGGGPGIMEAASCGAIISPGNVIRIIGIGVRDLGERPNRCVQEYFELDHFFARKMLLTHYSHAFIIFPGGYGTLDEMAEVLTLIQMKRLPRVPVILVGKEFWKPFLTWLHDEALSHAAIDTHDLSLFTVTDDFEKIACIISDECKVVP